MAVNKLPNGRWEAKVSYRDKNDSSKVKAKKKRFDTRRDALDWEYNIKRSLQTEFNPSMTYKDLFEDYLDWNSQRANERTIQSKRFLANNFWAHLFGLKVANIKRKHYLDVWISINETDYSDSRKNSAIILLKAVSRFGYTYYDFPDNAKTLETVKQESREHRDLDIWTYSELETFLPYVDNELIKILFHFLFFTGMRVGEARALQKDDFDHTGVNVTKTVRSFNQGLKPLKTESSKRYIDLDDNTIKMIEPLLEQEGNFIFGGHAPIGMSTIQRAWDKAILESKVKRIKIHDLRHSHASLLINKGVNIVAVSRRLGHSDVQTTLRTYTHLLQETNDKMMKTLNDLTKL